VLTVIGTEATKWNVLTSNITRQSLENICKKKIALTYGEGITDQCTHELSLVSNKANEKKEG
jgi:hypothetical protein